MFSYSIPKEKDYDDLESGEFYDLMLESDNVLLDVRTAGEFESGSLRGAINFDVSSSNFMNLIQDLPKDKTIMTFCRTGNRSGMACRILVEIGFEKVKNLKRGLQSWPFEIV